jgi:hypothetical protein
MCTPIATDGLPAASRPEATITRQDSRAQPAVLRDRGAGAGFEVVCWRRWAPERLRRDGGQARGEGPAAVGWVRRPGAPGRP